MNKGERGGRGPTFPRGLFGVQKMIILVLDVKARLSSSGSSTQSLEERGYDRTSPLLAFEQNKEYQMNTVIHVIPNEHSNTRNTQ